MKWEPNVFVMMDFLVKIVKLKANVQVDAMEMDHVIWIQGCVFVLDLKAVDASFVALE